MKRLKLLLPLLFTLTAAGCGAENPTSDEPLRSLPADESANEEQVQSDVRKMIDAVYGAQTDVVLDYTHPKVIEMLGGRSQAKTTLDTAFSQLQSLNMKMETFEFPEAPTFLETEVNDFVIVPTKTVIVANGQRAESLNYQFGNRTKGTASWKYIEGSRVNKQNVRTLFPDFPPDYEFPAIYRKKI
jgi:hypothetical protein